MDYSVTQGPATSPETLSAIGYLCLVLILFSIGLYGFLVLFQMVSAQLQQLSL